MVQCTRAGQRPDVAADRIHQFHPALSQEAGEGTVQRTTRIDDRQFGAQFVAMKTTGNVQCRHAIGGEQKGRMVLIRAVHP